MASGSRIIELLDTHLEIEDRPDARALKGFCNSIEFRNICFDYVDQNGETRVLRDINLKVKRNSVIALVGSSGSGKTTLILRSYVGFHIDRRHRYPGLCPEQSAKPDCDCNARNVSF
jgi:ABC-type multidrug transport system fused ATPase/permease subunit